jgi:hypothetical protein
MYNKKALIRCETQTEFDTLLEIATAAVLELGLDTPSQLFRPNPQQWGILITVPDYAAGNAFLNTVFNQAKPLNLETAEYKLLDLETIHADLVQ